MKTYFLVNPIMTGSGFKSTVKANNSNEAAQKMYKKMSEHYSNNVGHFGFTLQTIESKNDIGSGRSQNYHSFLVSEKRAIGKDTKKLNAVKYIIKEIELDKNNLKHIKHHVNTTLNKMNDKSQQGGGYRRYNDDLFNDDDLFDDDHELFDDDDENWLYDIYRHKKYRETSRLHSYWYYPWVYNSFILTDYIHIPTFKLNATPYIRIFPPFGIIP